MYRGCWWLNVTTFTRSALSYVGMLSYCTLLTFYMEFMETNWIWAELEWMVSHILLIFTLLLMKIYHILPSYQKLKAATCILGLTEESWQLPALVSISLLNPRAVTLYCMCAHEETGYPSANTGFVPSGFYWVFKSKTLLKTFKTLLKRSAVLEELILFYAQQCGLFIKN